MDNLTVGDAVDAYRTLQGLSPQALSRKLTDQVVEAAQALEPVATTYGEKMQKHQERLMNGEEELSDDAKEELESIQEDLRSEPVDVAPPTINLQHAPSVAIMRELSSIDALEPVVREA